MYYSSLGSNPLISRADMDGQNQVVIANLSFVKDFTLIDVVLDKPNNRLFFSDQTNEVIRYINLDNWEINTLLSGNLHKPTGLTMLNNTLYWTASGEGQFSGAIFKANITNGTVSQAMVDSLGEPNGIYAHNSLASQITGN